MTDFTIITKMNYHDGCVCHTPIGYTSDVNICNYLNEVYDSTLGAWITENQVELENGNVQISDFFSETEFVYVARTNSNVVVDLQHITNIEQL